MENHICTVCGKSSWNHREKCDCGKVHFPAPCCIGCDCGSYEEIHKEKLLTEQLAKATTRIAELEAALAASHAREERLNATVAAQGESIKAITQELPCGHPGAALATEDNGAEWCEWCVSLAAERSKAESESIRRVVELERLVAAFVQAVMEIEAADESDDGDWPSSLMNPMLELYKLAECGSKGTRE